MHPWLAAESVCLQPFLVRSTPERTLMIMQTITTSHFALPRQLAPTLANSVAMIGAPRQTEHESPTVSVTTFDSLQNLYEMMRTLDGRFNRHLGVAIELDLHCSPDWNQFGRKLGRGGQLVIVSPDQSRFSRPMSKAENGLLPIAGWDGAKRCVTIDQAIGRLLSGTAELDRCFILRPECHDPSDIFTAIGRHLTATTRSAADAYAVSSAGRAE